uniref:Uncharacterized protein n=1 Tax=Helianthus annuus TaxID=4232 RepID=A0A251VQJ7_HELAN
MSRPPTPSWPESEECYTTPHRVTESPKNMEILKDRPYLLFCETVSRLNHNS